MAAAGVVSGKVSNGPREHPCSFCRMGSAFAAWRPAEEEREAFLGHEQAVADAEGRTWWCQLLSL